MSEFVMVKRELVGESAELLEIHDSGGGSREGFAAEELRAVLAQEAGAGEVAAYVLHKNGAIDWDQEVVISNTGGDEPDERFKWVPVYTSPPAPVSTGLDPCKWTDQQVLDFLGVALRNVDLVGKVSLSEIRQGFEHMRDQIDKVKELNGSHAIAIGMRDFANAMIDIALEGGNADGAHIQALAVEHGLLKPEQRTERCGESCSCAAFADWPVECFRKVKELNQ